MGGRVKQVELQDGIYMLLVFLLPTFSFSLCFLRLGPMEFRLVSQLLSHQGSP